MTVTRFANIIICIALAGFLFWLEHNYSINRLSTLVQIEYEAKSDGVGQLFWVTDNNSYHELNSSKFRIIDKNKYYAVFIPPLELIKSIRFDPTNDTSQVILKSVVFKENDQVQRFDSPEKLKTLLTPINNSVTLVTEQNDLRIIPHSRDPQLRINLDYLQINSTRIWKIFLILLMVLPVWIFLPKLGEMIPAFFTTLRSGGQRERLLVYIEIVLSIVVALIVLTYVYNWSVKMTSNSLWTDEIYTIDKFSSKGPLVTLTDYHAANNHIFFNFVNSILPGSDSYDPLRARALSICAIFFCIITTVYFYFRRKWYFAGALVLFALTNSWTHMDLMLQARGYGVVVLCGVVIVYCAYSYINQESRFGLIGMLIASVIGTWTVPTFGFFSLSLTGLILLVMRRKKLFWGVSLSYFAVALLYVPLLPAMIRINSGYTGRWGAEFGSFGAVSTTIRNYLLPGASDSIILLLCVLTLSVLIVPWKRLGYGNTINPFRFVSAAICLFFTICLLLKTPAIRTAAFVVVPVAIVSISVAYFIVSGFLIGRYAKIIVFVISTVLIYQNIGVKNKTLDRYYVPHENWLETASVISHLFPPERVSIYNHHRTSNLLKYLPENYELDNNFLENKFIVGQQVSVNSDSSEAPDLDEHIDPDSALSLKVAQTRGDFQLVSFEPGKAIPDKNIIYQSTSQCSSVNFSTPLSELNRCSNYVDSQVLNIDLQGLGQTYSINIQGTGLTTDSLSSVTAFKDNKAEILDPDDIKLIFFEGREWKRHPRTFESLLSISLKGKDYDNLKISLSSMRPGRRYFVKSIWYE